MPRPAKVGILAGDRRDRSGSCSHVMVQKPKASELVDAFAEDLLAERSARPLVIVGASRVDHLLLEMLRGFLLPEIAKGKDKDELLERDHGPLGTFSGRIKMCRRLGLIDKTLYLALEKLRTIRNSSAHSISFDAAKSPVREHLSELRRHISSRSSYRLTKERYFDSATPLPIEELQCLLLTICVLLEAIREVIEPTSGNKGALSIAAK